MKHPAIIESGKDWVRFRALSPDTLDEILCNGELINQLTKEVTADGTEFFHDIWYVEFEPPRC